MNTYMNTYMYRKPGAIVELWRKQAKPQERKNYRDCQIFTLKAESFERTQREPYFFIDHSIGQLVYISRNLQNCLPRLGEDIYGVFYENSSQRIIPGHFCFVTQLSFKWAFEYLYQLPKEKRLEMYIFKDFQYRYPDGRLVWLLMCTTVVDLGMEGGILLTMSTIYEINHLRKGNHCNLIITGKGLKPEMYQFDSQTGELERLKALTAKEWEILEQLNKSCSSKDMAAQMGTTTGTVYTQRQKLLDRFGCKDITALVQYFKQVGILEFRV
jgi:DNA-binding CsgD family transcriptional regulator